VDFAAIVHIDAHELNLIHFTETDLENKIKFRLRIFISALLKLNNSYGYFIVEKK